MCFEESWQHRGPAATPSQVCMGRVGYGQEGTRKWRGWLAEVDEHRSAFVDRHVANMTRRWSGREGVGGFRGVGKGPLLL